MGDRWTGPSAGQGLVQGPALRSCLLAVGPSASVGRGRTHSDRSLHPGPHLPRSTVRWCSSWEAQGLCDTFPEEVKADEGGVISAEDTTRRQQSGELTHCRWPGMQGTRGPPPSGLEKLAQGKCRHLQVAPTGPLPTQTGGCTSGPGRQWIPAWGGEGWQESKL